MDCSELPGRLRQICDGTAGVSEEKRQLYIKRWKAVGWQRPSYAKPEPAPKHGPGTELEAILKERGHTVARDCGCRDKIAQMNRWGVDGCRENIDTITDWLIDAAKSAGWLEAFAVSTPGLATIARREIRAMIDEAIDRAARR